MLSTYHGYMLGYWTYIAEHTTNDGISFCMNDTFCWRFFEIVMSLSIMVIIIIITTFLTNYISSSIKRSFYFFCQVHFVKCQCVCMFENGFLRGNKEERCSWLPDGYSQILRSYVFGPAGFKDYGSATLRCKI